MAGNEKPVLLWSSYIWKIITFEMLNETKQARYSRPDPRRDSCMYVVTDTSGSSEMCAEQQYKKRMNCHIPLLVVTIFKLSPFKGGLTCEPVRFWTTYRVAKWNETTVRLYKGVHVLQKLYGGIRLLSAVPPQSAVKPVNTLTPLPENKSPFKIKTRSADKAMWLQKVLIVFQMLENLN